MNTKNTLSPGLTTTLAQYDSASSRHVLFFRLNYIFRPGDNLFSLRNNLRYGCVILKYYLDREKGDLFRALSRYNGSLGKPEYPNMVIGAWRSVWRYQGKLAVAPASPEAPPG